jgi:hypothetical protein
MPCATNVVFADGEIVWSWPPDAEAKLRMTLSLDPTIDLVLVDKVQIQQVALNLMRNGIEAMKSSSHPELVVTTTPEANNMIAVSVAHGVGASGAPTPEITYHIDAHDIGRSRLGRRHRLWCSGSGWRTMWGLVSRHFLFWRKRCAARGLSRSAKLGPGNTSFRWVGC